MPEKSMHLLTGRARRAIGLLLLIGLLGVSVAQAAPLSQAAAATITSPTDGQALRGNVAITGAATHPDFERYELAYGPDPNPNDAWQVFSGNNQSVDNGPLGIWNTSVVADGTYIIRLRVIRKDGNYNEAFARGLKIGNQQSNTPPTINVPAPTFGPEATVEPVGTIMVEQPPTSAPTSSANAANNTQTLSNTVSANASNSTNSSSNTFTKLISSACLSGLGWTFGAFILFGVIALGRGKFKNFRRRQRKNLSDANTQSTPPPAAQ